MTFLDGKVEESQRNDGILYKRGHDIKRNK